VRADIVPFDRAGIRGQDMLRLLQSGVVSFGTAILSLSATEDPLVGLLDLPGASTDTATLRRAVAAFRPLLAQHLRQTLGVELLAIYAYPAQVMFCRQPFATLADLTGRRVRVSSATQADFIEALGATPVLSPFAEIMPRLRAGQIDCAITGTMSGNTIGLHEVTSHLHTLPINWGLSVFAAGRSAWAGLPADVRQMLLQELPQLEQAIWADAERETGEGIACNSGSDACRQGQRGRMVLVRPGAADQERLRGLLASTVLPRWVERCGNRCADAWDSTLAPVVGVRLRPAGR
jgi:TRAP-type C4-dicarboxylate transport system substrate-binding protein